jgi:pimeloyl-ACP methyl ester carboxylesterase
MIGRWKMLTIALLGVAIAYGGACLWLYNRQARMMFFPSPMIEKTPAALGLAFEDVWIPVAHPSGTEHLHGWWMPSNRTQSKVVLYLHGNGVNIGANVNQASRFHQLGCSVLLVDYRGYGKSDGAFPSERQIYADAEAMWQYLTEVRHIPPEQIVLYGHSMGGAIAIELALRHPEAAGLMVQSSFTSMYDMAQRTTIFDRFLPLDRLLTQRFDSLRKIPQLEMPLLLIHGQADQDVPADMSETLYDQAPEPKQLFLVPGADHNNVADVAGDRYLQIVGNWLNCLSSYPVVQAKP